MPLATPILHFFSAIYGAALQVREYAYQKKILKSFKFDIPTIAIGNAATGGTGKTPCTQYLTQLLLHHHLLPAIISRGYRRQTKGFLLLTPQHTPTQTGDEPYMLYHHFNQQVPFAVAEQRLTAIPQLLYHYPETQAILLDDALQHRPVTPSFAILLTTYSNPFFNDYLLPQGNLRELPQNTLQRTNIIVVTKCPATLTSKEQAFFVQKINPLPHQQVFFSTQYYPPLQPFLHSLPTPQNLLDTHVLLLTAIANNKTLVDFLTPQCANLQTLEYKDHHNFSHIDFLNAATAFDKIPATNKIIITTQKDATRLLHFQKQIEALQLPIFIQPVEMQFLTPESQALFDQTVLEHVNNQLKEYNF